MYLDLTQFQPIISKKNGELFILDSTRNKTLVLTPEEWVRQGVIYHLAKNSYPPNLMQIERGIAYPNRLKRPDILIYDRAGKPFLLIECKASYIELNENTLSQVLAYNWVVEAPYIAITNGTHFFVYDIAVHSWLADLPA